MIFSILCLITIILMAFFTGWPPVLVVGAIVHGRGFVRSITTGLPGSAGLHDLCRPQQGHNGWTIALPQGTMTVQRALTLYSSDSWNLNSQMNCFLSYLNGNMKADNNNKHRFIFSFVILFFISNIPSAIHVEYNDLHVNGKGWIGWALGFSVVVWE